MLDRFGSFRFRWFGIFLLAGIPTHLVMGFSSKAVIVWQSIAIVKE